ncbi:MAG: nitrous oxide reductase family maturation protein NosD [Acidobacteria bacterium]|nr:nitrous oxide reductase family maturation protein NosD [Acidobacteriota bacterium]
MRSFCVGFILLACVFVVHAGVLEVGADKQFRTVGDAIAAAKAGDTIRVHSGIYIESLLIDRPLTIEGVGSPTIKGTGKGSVIEITADNCIVSGLKVEASGSDLVNEDAGILLRSNGNTIADIEMRDILFGIYLFHSSNNKIVRNQIFGRPELESGARGGGIHVWNSAHNLFEDNVVTAARDGMYIQNSSDNTFRRNRVFDLRYGLHFMNSDDNLFEENVFYDNIAGAAIMYSKNIVLRRNTFVHNRGFSSFGILFQDCRECTIEENLVLDNAVGLFLEASLNSTFRRNTIAENDVAMEIFASSENNTFTENNFINNMSPLTMIGRTSSTKWTSDRGGNYWDDYDGYDLDTDGKGDVAHPIHNIFEYLEGNFPRVRIYLNSPAAQALVAAEKAFPILKGSNEFDRRPLMSPVKIDTVFPPRETGGSAKWFLLAFSAVLLGVSFAVFRGGVAR